MKTRTLGPLRDLLYLDFEKAASIWSQFEQGLVERVSITEDTATTRAAGAKIGVPGIAGANLGADYLDKRSTLESKVLHHDVLSRVEERLEDAGLVADLAESLSSDESSSQKIREAIGDHPYIRAIGPSFVEDYMRILAISEKFNDLVGFIVRAGQETAKQSAEYKRLQDSIAQTRELADKIADRNQKAVLREQIKAIQRQIEDLVKPKLSGLDDWLLNGIRLWINTFMPNRINFRIYPFERCPSFQVLCNLKRECFVDSDLEHLLYGYGNRPNVPLAVFGLVTSIPSVTEVGFDPMKEFETGEPLAERAAFEKAFRAMFGGIEGMEAFVRFSRYPNVTVHPIAVYRSFSAVGETG